MRIGRTIGEFPYSKMVKMGHDFVYELFWENFFYWLHAALSLTIALTEVGLNVIVLTLSLLRSSIDDLVFSVFSSNFFCGLTKSLY